ncbi:hypothetical protein Cni_G00667 [Canna indica]|uniref:NAC domain-containing protein n=1 Tax=Canna indica TaxID=4628 RepID=A0AAQ3JN54_9LILI|nr:hypothetical protein Cni_G00667 [Canna indica]
MEDALWDLVAEDVVTEQGLPPGFRFHPTDEELVTFYLASKVFNGGFCGIDIAEVDLNRCEPWELPEMAKMGEREWYFFSLRDRKYPTGLRTNRATGAGYWKATGKDREVHSGATGALVGMKKTLVFYKGRAPRGEKTKWVLHEYRLDGDFSCRHACKEEWVICRILHKAAGEKKGAQYYTSHAFSSSSQNPCLPPFPDLMIPPFSVCQEANQYPVFPVLPPIASPSFPISLHDQPPKQEETTMTLSSCWLDAACSQINPFLCESMCLPRFGPEEAAVPSWATLLQENLDR